jgi:hypothetical protein
VLKRLVVLLFTLFVCFAGVADAQQAAVEDRLPFVVVPLNVPTGYPFEIILTDKLRFKLNEPVHGRIIEPVFAFDRQVIPSGTEVVGRITGFRSGGKWKRVTSFLGGDFTPVRTPEITFDTLVFEDGTRVPIKTSIEPAANELVVFNDETKKTAAPKSSEQTNAQAKALVAVHEDGAKELVKRQLWNLAPYHPQSVPVGVRYRATLQEQLEFGSAFLNRAALDEIGTDAPTGSTLYVRLQTPLNSRVTKPGEMVSALLTRPVFSSDGLVVFPVGSKLVGEVLEVRGASKLHHNGELSFKFTKMEPPVSILFGGWPEQEIETSLAGIAGTPDISRLRLTPEGVIRVDQSKERFLAPALSLFGLRHGFSYSAESFGPAVAGAYSGNLIKRFIGANTGFGLPAAIAGRMVPPIGVGLGIYGVSRSVFSNLLARGQEINFPVDTPMQIRLGALP